MFKFGNNSFLILNLLSGPLDLVTEELELVLQEHHCEVALLPTLGHAAGVEPVAGGVYHHHGVGVLHLLDLGDALVLHFKHLALVLLQLASQVKDLFVGFFHLRAVRGGDLADLINIDSGFDVLSLLPEVQGVQRLLVVAQRLRDRAYNGSLGVAT